MLLIRRAEVKGDPWYVLRCLSSSCCSLSSHTFVVYVRSGNIAFPGGKVDPTDASLYETAVRETEEEVGVRLEWPNAHYLGCLGEVGGMAIPINVTCFVFLLRPAGNVVLRPNKEVSDHVWFPVESLFDQNLHSMHRVEWRDSAKPKAAIYNVPAIKIYPETQQRPVLWGLTYRFAMDFIRLLAPEKVPHPKL
jgi:8-oxo-dGTP pyrophosphatase MutT (NUDIX family)